MKWIKVDDNLPDVNKNVLVSDEFGNMAIAYLNDEDEFQVTCFGEDAYNDEIDFDKTSEYITEQITYWMELPENNIV